MLCRREIEHEINKFSLHLIYPVREGTCLDCSSEFAERLHALGHSCVSIQFGWLDHQKHAWIEVWAEDMPLTLVDFTASQFGYQKLIKGIPEEVFKKYAYEYDMCEES